MKRLIKLITITAFSFVLYSCQQDYVAPNQFSDIMFTISNGNTNGSATGVLAVSQNFYLTFMDLSQGAISHNWSITGQDGLKFLSNGFSAVTTDSLNRQNHIIPDSVLNSKTVNVFFKKEGIYTVTWKDVFKDSVGYISNGSVRDSISHNWLFKKIFTVQVYGRLIPLVTIYKNTSEQISNSVDTIRLSIGDNLTFTEASKGYPTSRTWTINGGTPSSDVTSNFTTKFNKAGIYTNSSLTLNRTVSSNPSLAASLKYPLPVIKVQ